MIELDARNVLAFLRSEGRALLMQAGLAADDLSDATARELAWGVSNIVMRVDAPRWSLVLKQSRQQLRTKIDWFSRLERIWREVDVLKVLAEILPEQVVPRVLFEDRENYLFAMQAVEADHRVWKAELLAGRFDLPVAETLGRHLARIHRATTGREDLREKLGDRTFFDELRLDPFYRYMANTLPDRRDVLLALIETTLARQDCLVLADFSPKNILLTSHGPVLVDFETGHYGDPGFDLGFFLSHLLLKAIKHNWSAESRQPAITFWQSYHQALLSDPAPAWADSDFEHRCIQHLAACLQSRIDGKSRIDYLPDPAQADRVRALCSQMWSDSRNSSTSLRQYL